MNVTWEEAGVVRALWVAQRAKPWDTGFREWFFSLAWFRAAGSVQHHTHRDSQQGQQLQLSDTNNEQRSQITGTARPSQKMSAQTVARAGSSFLGTPKAAIDHSSSSNKQADMYISELLSYSLDRMRKVRSPACTCPLTLNTALTRQSHPPAPAGARAAGRGAAAG